MGAAACAAFSRVLPLGLALYTRQALWLVPAGTLGFVAHELGTSG